VNGGGKVMSSEGQENAVQRYLDAARELRVARWPSSLTAAEEAQFVTRLEDLWASLTPEEQAQAEGQLNPTGAPTDLGLVDRAVQIGDRKSPREPANITPLSSTDEFTGTPEAPND